MTLGAERRHHLEFVAQPLDAHAELVENQRGSVVGDFLAKARCAARGGPDQLRGDDAEPAVGADFLDRRLRQFREQTLIALRREQVV